MSSARNWHSFLPPKFLPETKDYFQGNNLVGEIFSVFPDRKNRPMPSPFVEKNSTSMELPPGFESHADVLVDELIQSIRDPEAAVKKIIELEIDSALTALKRFNLPSEKRLINCKYLESAGDFYWQYTPEDKVRSKLSKSGTQRLGGYIDILPAALMGAGYAHTEPFYLSDIVAKGLQLLDGLDSGLNPWVCVTIAINFQQAVDTLQIHYVENFAARGLAQEKTFDRENRNRTNKKIYETVNSYLRKADNPQLRGALTRARKDAALELGMNSKTLANRDIKIRKSLS